MNVPRIVQLDALVSNQIAAGEVIERPASIIKELVENALDAKATQIDIELEGAGVHLIRIRDNGVGIEKADLPLAFARHATSKIRQSEDLFSIQSLGFRGEALASIASVARCRIISCAHGQHEAWRLDNDGGLLEVCPAAHAVGTTVEISDLFYNVPVRRKFLRSPKTEFQSMEEMVKRLALSHPEVRFKLTHQHRLVRHFPALSEFISPKDRIAKICGNAFIQQAAEVSLTAGEMSLEGWVGLPKLAHRQGDCQYFFINQRMVKDRFIHQIIRTLFQQHPDYTEGSYPCYVLYLTLDPTDIDVNVHPTKQEVRFHQPRWVHDFISKTISIALEKTIVPLSLSVPGLISAPPTVPSSAPRYESKQNYWPLVENKQPHSEGSVNPGFQRRYAFLEKPEGVYRIDLMKAQTRLLTLYIQSLQYVIPTKTLLFPEIIPSLSKTVDLYPLQSTLKAWGFQIQKQGVDWVLVQQPAFIKGLHGESLSALIQLCFKENNSVEIAQFLAEFLTFEHLFSLTVHEFEALLSRWMETAPLDYFAQIC